MQNISRKLLGGVIALALFSVTTAAYADDSNNKTQNSTASDNSAKSEDSSSSKNDGEGSGNNQAAGKPEGEGKSTNAPAKILFSTSTGVQGSNNNIKTVGTGANAYQVDNNWKVAAYYDSYGLTRSDVFGKGVKNPNGVITDPISSASATRNFGYSAYVNTGGNRPGGWYNPGDGAQWLGASLNENNGGIPVDPPGNYVYQLDLSKYIDPKGGMVTISIADINADNHYELAMNGSVAAESFLAKAFAPQETWNQKGDAVKFSFSPLDGGILDLIVANANDQTSNGKYSYQKNPTGFLIDGLTVVQSSGPTPARDKMTSTAQIYRNVAPNSGPVYRQGLVSAPEPSTWLIMAAFIVITVTQVRRGRSNQS